MTHQLWIQAFNPANCGLVSWYLQIGKEGVAIHTDAITQTNCWLQPFEVAKGRSEIIAVFFTARQYKKFKLFLLKLQPCIQLNENIEGAKTNLPKKLTAQIEVLSPALKEMLHLLHISNSFKEAARAGNFTINAITKATYRLRLKYGVKTTRQLIAVLKADGLL